MMKKLTIYCLLVTPKLLLVTEGAFLTFDKLEILPTSWQPSSIATNVK
jgi:hypothetical protein